ncbi:glucosamine--fructose-6-phosphate aminotransferase [Pullulanibacillus camelliae]|uniref:Glucosamine--fructose-6-phosphate aminotransferase n=1 Tax=Pullulanibacillus camelliae TaxID=1707096 RepID=A0A8J3E004_9BACL|nr:SIS domain-containing protein [Pullulanibacillus camelliae]GGE52510.1 glucosamine--fructose-6-phosphate aminotransferase [Pullulanibacillus camelliae]
MESNLMEAYINKQQETLLDLLEDEQSIKNVVKSIDEEQNYLVCLVACGSSLNAAMAVKPIWEHYTTAEIVVCNAFQFRHYAFKKYQGRKGIAIVISQSGRSTGTLDCIQVARQMGLSVVSLTADATSPIAKAGDSVIDIGCGEEAIGPKTAGYTATLMRLIQIAVAFGEKHASLSRRDHQQLMDTLKKDLNDIQTLILQMKHWVKQHVAWKQAPYITVVGYGQELGTLYEGQLKLLETLRIPVLAYDIEEFTHGPHRLIQSDSFHIFIKTDESGRAMTDAITQFIEGVNRNILVLTVFEPHSKYELTIQCQGQLSKAIKFVIPFQVLANELALLTGFNPDTSVYPEFFSKLRTKTT